MHLQVALCVRLFLAVHVHVEPVRLVRDVPPRSGVPHKAEPAVHAPCRRVADTAQVSSSQHITATGGISCWSPKGWLRNVRTVLKRCMQAHSVDASLPYACPVARCFARRGATTTKTGVKRARIVTTMFCFGHASRDCAEHTRRVAPVLPENPLFSMSTCAFSCAAVTMPSFPFVITWKITCTATDRDQTSQRLR